MINDIDRTFPNMEPALRLEIKEHGVSKELQPGDILMRKGQFFRSGILVLDGLIKVYREDEEGNEFFMYYIKPGQACVLSLICAVQNQSSQLLGRAVLPTHIWAIPLQVMDRWMTTYRTWYYFILESYRSRFEELITTIDQIAFSNLDERLLFYLKRHQDVHGEKVLTLSNTTIAHELNSSREVISRLMKKLAEKGYIRLLKGQQIEIVDLKVR